MKTKLLVAALAIIGANSASAALVDIDWSVYSISNTTTALLSGTQTAGNSALLIDPTLVSPLNNTPYVIKFSIAPASLTGTVTAVNWFTQANAKSGGSYDFDAGSVSVLTSFTSVKFGTGVTTNGVGNVNNVSGQFNSVTATAGNPINPGDGPYVVGVDFGGHWDLTDSTVNGSLVNTAVGTNLTIWAYINGLNTVTTDTTYTGGAYNYANLLAYANVTYQDNAAPEPASALLAGLGLIGAVAARRRNRKAC